MTDWTEDAVERILREKGWDQSVHQVQYGIPDKLPDGTKLYTLSDGSTKVILYRTGTVHVHGKDTPIKREAERIFAGSMAISRARATAAAPDSGVPETAAPVSGVAATAPRRVFVVYGHDDIARRELADLLRRLKIEPIILQNIPGRGDTIIEKLEQLTTDADFACVLLTPDDEGRKRVTDDKPLPPQPRARQNVVLELGMVLSRLGRSRVAILVKGGEIERPSDIEGLIYIPFSTSVDDAKNKLAANLQEAGFDIRVGDLDA